MVQGHFFFLLYVWIVKILKIIFMFFKVHLNFDLFSKDLIKSKDTNNNGDSNFNSNQFDMFSHPACE